jgi:competence protein ComEC
MKTLKPTLGFLVSFLVTLFCLRFWQSAHYPVGFYVSLTGIIAFSGIFAMYQKRTTVWIIAAIALGIMVALGSADRTVHVTTSSDIESFADSTNHTLHGWIVEDPDVRPVQTRLIIAVDSLDESTNVRGRVLVTEYGGYPPHRYGDEVKISGKLRLPEVIEGFDYPHYLELSGVRALISRGSVHSVKTDVSRPAHTRTLKIFGLLYDLRKAIEDRIGLIFPEPHASLLAGLLTGSRRGLPQHLSDDFRTSGITHIIAVSGYNITIILTLLSGILFWIPVKKRFWPLVFMVTAFTIFVGAGAPVVRAAIMGILGLLALQAERVAIPRLTILWTAFFMLLWNPHTDLKQTIHTW